MNMVADGGIRSTRRLPGKRLWDSEYGESDGTGISLASNLNLDFRWLHPTAWCYWQVLDSGGWGLVQSNPGDNWIGPANPKYYVLAQYTRHIRPGMTIIDGGEGNTIAAYQPAARKLVIVTMNYDTAQTITLQLVKILPSVRSGSSLDDRYRIKHSICSIQQSDYG